jgi:hypothetical protein
MQMLRPKYYQKNCQKPDLSLVQFSAFDLCTGIKIGETKTADEKSPHSVQKENNLDPTSGELNKQTRNSE